MEPPLPKTNMSPFFNFTDLQALVCQITNNYLSFEWNKLCNHLFCLQKRGSSTIEVKMMIVLPVPHPVGVVEALLGHQDLHLLHPRAPIHQYLQGKDIQCVCYLYTSHGRPAYVGQIPKCCIVLKPLLNMCIGVQFDFRGPYGIFGEVGACFYY